MRAGCRTVFFFLIWSGGFFAAAKAETLNSPLVKKLDLKEATRLARLNNPALLASLEDIAIAEQRLRMARHLRLPQVGFDANMMRYRSERSFTFSEHSGGLVLTPGGRENLYLGRAFLEQELYAGGRTKNAVVIAKTALEKAKNEGDKAELKIVHEVSLKFLEYIEARERLQVLEILLVQMPKPGKQKTAGALALLEDERLDLSLEFDELRLKTLPGAQSALLGVMGMDLSRLIETDMGLVDLPMLTDLPTLQEALSWAREYRPEYKTEALASEMDAAQVAIALAGRRPIVSLGGMYEFLGPDFPLRAENWSGMLRVHLPFSWDYWSTVRERKAQHRKGQVGKVDIDDRIAVQVRETHGQLVYSLKELAAAKERFRLWRDFYAKTAPTLEFSEDRLMYFMRYKKAWLGWIEVQSRALRARYEFQNAIGRSLD